MNVIKRFEAPPYRECAISVMDNAADPDIRFDEKGICNYYYEYLLAEKEYTLRGEEAERKIGEIVRKIKAAGKYREYDCILGVSGGVDSSFLAWNAKLLGLRVLCVHFDNGWNSELAVKNIENLVSRCGFQLYTYVIDWPEFRDIQLAYLKAGVIDIEAITDIAIHDALNNIAMKLNIRFVLTGTNVWTEFTLPKAWINKNPNNLYNIHQKFGTMPLKNYPAVFRNGSYHPQRERYQSMALLNFLDYDKKKARQIIEKELGWRDYGGKHYESVFTRFYQGYILPAKFGVDKRRAHLSNLIFAGQLTKEEALQELERPIYPREIFETDRQFVLKKLGLSEAAFMEYVDSPPVDHATYGGHITRRKASLAAIARMKLGAVKQKIFAR